MSTTATSGAGALSRFAHFAGIVAKPKADDAPAIDDVEEVINETLDEIQNEIDDHVDPVDEIGAEAAAAEQGVSEPAADKPAERAAYLAGRKAERVRAGAILSAPIAAKNRNLALHLAFEGDLPAKQAIALLKASAAGAPTPAAADSQAKPAGSALDTRMSGSKPVNLGSGAAAAGPDMNTPEGVAAFVLGAGKPRGQK